MRGLWLQLDQIRRWLQGVEEARYPALQRYLARTLRGYAICMLWMPLVFVSPHLSNLGVLGEAQWWSLGALSVGGVGLCAVAFSGWSARWGAWSLVVYQALHLGAVVGFTWGLGAFYMQGALVYVGLPCLTAVFLPQRPSLLLLVGALVALMLGWMELALLDAGGAASAMLAAWSLVFGVVGGLASQRQRRLWARLGEQQEALFAVDRVAELGQRTVTLALELERPLQDALVTLTEALEGARALEEEVASGEVEALRRRAAELQPQMRGSADRLLDMGQRLQSIREQTRISDATQGFSPLVSAQRALSPVTARERAQPIRVCAEGEVAGLTLRGDPLQFEHVLALLAQQLRAQNPGAGLWAALEQREGALWVALGREGASLDARLLLDFQELLRRARSEEARDGLLLCRDIAQGVFEGELRAMRGGGLVWRLPVERRGAEAVRSGWAPRFGLAARQEVAS
jgi:hypothetical protein